MDLTNPRSGSTICSIMRSRRRPISAPRRDSFGSTISPAPARVTIQRGAGLHLALLDHADGRERRVGPRDAFVHWADAVIVASPICWGTASSLFSSWPDAATDPIANRVLIRNKVAGFIIVGGQDNIQMVAGQMLGFFAELGFIFPQFPFIAHSRGWSHEDMENNVAMVRNSKELADGACMLAKRLLDLAARLIAQDEAPASP
jgi:hypothetical protein